MKFKKGDVVNVSSDGPNPSFRLFSSRPITKYIAFGLCLLAILCTVNVLSDYHLRNNEANMRIDGAETIIGAVRGPSSSSATTVEAGFIGSLASSALKSVF